MTTTPNRDVRISHSTVRLARFVLAAGIALSGVAAHAVEVSSTPVTSTAPIQVKPNILFILDDSGSMGRNYMPDDANFGSGKYGFYAAQCNGLAYNPSVTYGLPVDSTGANMAAGAFAFSSPSGLSDQRDIVSATPSVAMGSIVVKLNSMSSGDYSVGQIVTLFSNSDTSKWMVGTVTAANSSTDQLTVNVTGTSGSGALNSPRVADGDVRPFHYTYSGSQPALGYTYNTSGLITSTTFYRECNSDVGSSPGNGLFTRVSVSPSDAGIQNYRNWYTYYRTRMLTMRAAASQAFKGIGDRYRVGFTTISSTVVNGAKFLDTSDFDATQKADWYSRLFTSDPDSYTPLRGALSKAGQYFAKRGTLGSGADQTVDPMQYSCQKNFAILTTDGYWNTDTETPTYGAFGLNRTTLVGQQDGTAPRPMKDAQNNVVRSRTSDLQQRSVSTQWQTATVALQSRTGRLQTSTSSDSGASWGGWTNTTSCDWDNSGGNRRRCQYNWSAWTNATTCSANRNTGTTGTWGIVNGTDCQYSTPVYADTASCTPSSPAPSAGPNYTVSTATVCNQQVTNGSWTNVSSCTASATNQCQYSAWTAFANTASCSAVAQSTGPNYTVGQATDCSVTSSGGTSDTLADVAMYYYNTDLRTAALGNCTGANGIDVCLDNVSPRGSDNATNQHMTTFTVGMGVNGVLGYHPNYLGGQSADFQALIQGTKEWPVPGPSEGAENIDDLWHAAVNGRGQYFSASNPTNLATSLRDTLTAIDARSGTASAAATTSLQPTPGDSREFVTSYTTQFWAGDVTAYQIDPSSGVRETTPQWSAQQKLDQKVAEGTARNIFYLQRTSGSNAGAQRDFTYANLDTDGLKTLFDGACSKAPALTQCAQSGYDTAGANNGANMVAFLRGQSDARFRTRQHVLADIVGGAPVYVRRSTFRYTENSYQTFVAQLDASNSGAGRTGVVYAPANDGMLHAFDGATGVEKWAYVPSMVMDRMYRLADDDYASRHEYFVNGAPVVGDIYVPGSGATPQDSWKTILVGGLGAGGRGYYALDITNPNDPKVLWEFSNDVLGGNGNLGLTFGNPLITKRADGRWVVAFTSGYNNVSPGDGNGRLFVVDANTGQRLTEIQTYIAPGAPGVPAGTAAASSGLAKINGWIASAIDNTTLRYYGGDLLGNVWRFDIDGQVAPNNAALRLAELRAGSPAAAQPITTKPELADVAHGGTNYPVVYVATGQLLGVSDLSTTAQQSVYAIKDPLTNTELGDVHARSDMVVQVLSAPNATTQNPYPPRSVTNNPVDWTTKSGWRVDLLSPGERVNIDMRLAYTTLIVGANIPSNDICTSGSGGTAFLYQFDINSGSSLPSANGIVGTWLGNSFAVGTGVMQQYGQGGAGTGDTNWRMQMGDGTVQQGGVYTPNVAAVGGRRASWRELVN
jgi:type IV pilus assembly protein PilY1